MSSIYYLLTQLAHSGPLQVLLIIFWQVLVFLIAFLSLKQAKNEGELAIVHGKARLKLKYMKNPSHGELQSLWKINQVRKEEKQRRNLSFKNFPMGCQRNQGRGLKALDVMNNLRLWMTWKTTGDEIRVVDSMKTSRLWMA